MLKLLIALTSICCSIDRMPPGAAGSAAKISPPPCVYGYVDRSGVEVIAPRYSNAGNFQHGYAICYRPDKSNSTRLTPQIFVDKNGNEFFAEDYVSAFDVSEKNFVNLGSKTVLFDGDFQNICSRNGMRLARNTYRYFLIDKYGTRFEIPISELKPCGINPKTGNYHFLKDKKSFEFTGRGQLGEIPGLEPAETSEFLPRHLGVTTRLNKTYDYIGEFSDGLAPARSNENRWCFIDKNGKEQITLPANCCSAESFSEGLAAIAIGGKPWNDYGSHSSISPLNGSKFGFINKTGNFVIPPTFPSPTEGNLESRFKNGLALATAERNQSTAYGYINKQGKFVVPAKYSKLREFSEGLAVFDSRQPGLDSLDWKDGGNKYKCILQLLRQYDICSLTRNEIVKLLGEPDCVREHPSADRYKLSQDCFSTQFFDVRYKADGTVYGHWCGNDSVRSPGKVDPSQWVTSSEKPNADEDLYTFYNRATSEVYQSTAPEVPSRKTLVP